LHEKLFERVHARYLKGFSRNFRNTEVTHKHSPAGSTTAITDALTGQASASMKTETA